MKIQSNFLGGLLFLLGVWFIFFEVGVVISEPHTFEGSGILLFAIFVCLGIGMIYGGIKLIKSKRIVGILLYIVAAFFLLISLTPSTIRGNWYKWSLLVPLCLIIGGTLLVIKKQRKNK
jgi:drug/metabolite transporter (DMT)-like permease